MKRFTNHERSRQQTLSRTILTSLSTLAVLVCLYFFGGPSMEDFAWTISAGILIGTYSSIFIASPAALFLLPEAWVGMKGSQTGHEGRSLRFSVEPLNL